MHGHGAADFLERALDALDPVEIEQGLLDALEHGYGGFERRAAAELHLHGDLLGLLRLLAQATDEDPGQRDHDGQQNRHRDTDDPRRRAPQRGLEQRREHGSRALRRQRASVLAAALGLAFQPRHCGRSREPFGEQRHETDGHQQRSEQRKNDRDRDELERAADRAVIDEKDGGQEHDAMGHAAGDDGAHRPLHCGDRGRIRSEPALEAALHGFVYDHAVVDERADADGQPEHRDQIQRVAAQVQHRARDEQAHGHGHRDDGHGAELAQKEEQHDQGDQESRDREVLQAVELLLDRLGGIEADREIDAVGPELFAQIVETLAQRNAEPHEIRAFFLEDDEPRRLAAVDAERALGACHAHLDIGHVPQQHGSSGIETDLAERRDAAGPPVEHDLPAAAVLLAAAEVAQPPHGLAQDPRDELRPYAEGRAAVGIDPDRHLARRAARRQDLAHALDRRHARLDALLDEVAQRVLVVAARHLDRHREAAERTQVARRHVDERALGLRALELGRDAAQLELAHAMIRAALELEREPPIRAVHLAPRLFEPGELADTRDERQQDLALHDLGLGAPAPELDRELLAGERRQELDRNAVPRERAEQHQRDEHHRRRRRPADGQRERVYGHARALSRYTRPRARAHAIEHEIEARRHAQRADRGHDEAADHRQRHRAAQLRGLARADRERHEREHRRRTSS